MCGNPQLIIYSCSQDNCSSNLRGQLRSDALPGDVVVSDNLGLHKGGCVRRRIRSAGARLYLLPP